MREVKRITKQTLIFEANLIRDRMNDNYGLLSNEGTQEIYNKLKEIRFELE